MGFTRRPLLVVEDNPDVEALVRRFFCDRYYIEFVRTRGEAIQALSRHAFPCILLDLGLPPNPGGTSEGFAALEQIRGFAPMSNVVIVTANTERETVIQATNAGAFCVLHKPIHLDGLAAIIDRAFEVYTLEISNLLLRDRLSTIGGKSPLKGIIAESDAMQDLCRTVERVASTASTVLLYGETGTGKELLARALHDLSDRRNGPYVAINCAAIPEELLEGELFGYERGAYTGAARTTAGKIEMAHGGTLMLDELGELPMRLQAKLLRFFQERVIERLGGRKSIPVDVRIVCATNLNLASMVRDRQFREDFFYRVMEICIEVPPLRDRAADALLLARAFLARFADQFSKSFRGFSEDAVAAILAHKWPGNVREVENRVRRAVILTNRTRITARDLELTPAGEEQATSLSLQAVRDGAERRAIMQAMHFADGRISRAAALLGVSRPTLYHLLDKHGLRETVADESVPASRDVDRAPIATDVDQPPNVSWSSGFEPAPTTSRMVFSNFPGDVVFGT